MVASILPMKIAVRSILDRQLRCISDDDEHARLGDGPTVARRLAAAASWGDASLTIILQTRAMSRSARRLKSYTPSPGKEARPTSSTLLRAGAELRPFENGRTALHAALSNGHEDVATALVAFATPDVVSTALQLARENDFPIARRIEARIRPAS